MPKELENPELKAKTYQCRFLEAGVVRYENETVLIRPENVMKIAETFKGIPVCIDHKDLNLSNISDHKVGLVTREIWRDSDAWANCSFLIDNKKGVDVIEEGYSVSCAYIPTEFAPGGIYHNIPYDREILAGVGVHLALVSNPRYEGATILANSKEKTMFKLFKNKKEEMSSENAIIEIDGAEISLADAVAAYKNSLAEAKKNAKAKMNAEDEVEVDGEKVKVSKLISSYKTSMKNKTKKNESEEEEEVENGAAEDAMDEDMDITPESPNYKVKNKAKENESDEEKEKEEAKKNAKFQNSLKEARQKAIENAAKAKKSIIYKTRPERIALGKKCFGA